jgi:hypothetical protein
VSTTISPFPVSTLVNEEEAWLHHVLKDFDYVVQSGKYGPLFYDLLSADTKQILFNMYVLEQNNLKVSKV